jgi:catechol 2,3-dioxygenase-like lactoylglutathione lyase family enzyme
MTHDLADTIKAVRPVLPARDFDTSKQFYSDLGFQARMLSDRLAEIRYGAYSFLLQDDYVEQWADNCVVHLLVTDMDRWWNHICSLDLASRYEIKIMAPRVEPWGKVAGLTDPTGVLWRIIEPPLHSSGANRDS